MKKWILVFVSVIIICIISTFVFIPSSLKVSGYQTAPVPAGSISRVFERGGNFSKWWPGEKINDSIFSFQDTRYSVLKSNALGISISASNNDFSVTGEINTIVVGRDSAAIILDYQSFNAGYNPIKRIENYFKAVRLKKQSEIILSAFKQFATDKKNIYGLDIVEAKVKDSSLISTKKYFDHYPTNKEVDELINKLKQHIAANGGVIRDYPMLNIHINEDKKYEAMVAIPLLKDIPVKGDIIIKKMILGNILEAKLTGGDFSINNGMNALKNYAKDHARVAPAIPFQLMITDRNRETDTTKWVTVVKYPVF